MQNSLATQKGLARIADYLSPRTLSKLLVGLIIFFSATQLGLHFWPSSSLVYGIRVDYLAPTLYFLDILIVMFLLIRRPHNKNFLVGILPILLLNLLYSQNPLATLSWSLHLVLYLMFFAALFHTRTLLVGIMRPALALALLFQLVLSIGQVSVGRSLGGLMYYLGERSVAVGSPGIALGSFMGEVVLRAYATFGHPNVLAGWAVIVLLIILRLRGLSSQARFPFLKGSGQTLWVLVTILILLLSQSRAAAFSLFAIIIPFYLLTNIKWRLLYISILLTSLLVVLPELSQQRPDSSLTERVTLQQVSLSVIQTHPFFGTGANASISTYPLVSPSTRLFQPDHNSLTLFFSWFGLFGALALLATAKRPNLKVLSSAILPLLPLVLFDHYFLTSPQGLFASLMYLQVVGSQRSG